jgi:hypothetical protein
MPYSEVTGRYSQTDSDEFPQSISRQQLFVLHVAANYQLLRSPLGWWCADRPRADLDWIEHSQLTVRSLLKKGLLEGNARGENIALEGWDGKSTMDPPIPKLWTSAKGKKLLDKITSETWLVFDRENYLVKFGADASEFQYYDLKKYWRKAKRHLGDKELNDILVRDFNKYTYGRWGKEFKHGQFPSDSESWEWRFEFRRPGRYPAFWKYAKHGACHWLVNFNLRWAMLTEPKRIWRIITSSKHSTVWDGNETLFDINFQAFGISPNECFSLAFKRQLKPGNYLKVYFYTPGADVRPLTAAEWAAIDKRRASNAAMTLSLG